MTLLTSKTTWIFIAQFVIAGLIGVKVISPELGMAVLAIITGASIKGHNTDIKLGKVV